MTDKQVALLAAAVAMQGFLQGMQGEPSSNSVRYLKELAADLSEWLTGTEPK